MIKNCITKLLFTVIVLCFFSMYGQYTNIINSNKPGFSESPYSVGRGVYQFENNLFFNDAPISSSENNLESYGLDFLVRTSFFSEKLEFNLNTSIQRDKIAFKNLFESSYNKVGLGNLTLGAKYLIYAPKYIDKKKEIRSFVGEKREVVTEWITDCVYLLDGKEYTVYKKKIDWKEGYLNLT